MAQFSHSVLFSTTQILCPSSEDFSIYRGEKYKNPYICRTHIDAIKSDNIQFIHFITVPFLDVVIVGVVLVGCILW